MFKTIIKKLSREERKLKAVLAEKENEIISLRFNVLAWQKIHEEDMGALQNSRNEIVGLQFQLDKKDAEIEDLKEQIRGAAS